MVNYKCLTCGKEFNRKSNFLTHTENKKKPCKPIVIEKYNQNSPNLTNFGENLPKLTKFNQNTINSEPIILNKTNEYNEFDKFDKLNEFIKTNKFDESIDFDQFNTNESNNLICKFCFKTFVNVYTLKRHSDGRCKVKKLDNKKKDEIFNRLLENEDKMDKVLNSFENIKKDNQMLQKENEKLKQHIKDLENKYNNDIKKIVNKNTNNTINNTNNNVNLIIPNDKLVDFGKEDLSKISYEDIIKSCSGSNVTGYHVLIELIKQIHFNDKFPEFQNVYMTDRNRERYMYWQNAWQLGDNNIFTEIMTQPQELLSTHEEKLQKDIENNKTTAKKINGVVDKYYDGEKGFNEVVDPKVKDLVYNNRDKIRNNYKKLVKENESKKLIDNN